MSLPTQRLFIGRARTVVGTVMISLVLVMTTGSRFSGDRTSYRSFQASKRLRGPCPSFVCFGASWPVDCCTCSRQQVAEGRKSAHCYKFDSYLRHRRRAKRADAVTGFDPSADEVVTAFCTRGPSRVPPHGQSARTAPYFCFTAATKVRPKITKKPTSPPSVLSSPPAGSGFMRPLIPTQSDAKARAMTAAQMREPNTGFTERSDLPVECDAEL
jgi:hypothetical protein